MARVSFWEPLFLSVQYSEGKSFAQDEMGLDTRNSRDTYRVSEANSTGDSGMPKRKSSSPKLDGLPVVDAIKRLTLHISDQDCKVGRTRRPESCAAALACLREVPGCTEARAHIARTYVKVGAGSKAHWVRYKTPGSLRGEILAFDRGGRFMPGEYELSPLPKSDRATGKAHSKPTLKRGRKGKHRSKPHTIHGVRTSGHVGWNMR